MNMRIKQIVTDIACMTVVGLVQPVRSAESAADSRESAKIETMLAEIPGKLTLEKKISLCHGNNWFNVNVIPRVGIRHEIALSNGSNNISEELFRESFALAGWTNDYSTALPTLTALDATLEPTPDSLPDPSRPNARIGCRGGLEARPGVPVTHPASRCRHAPRPIRGICHLNPTLEVSGFINAQCKGCHHSFR